jgi:hypothetical protein
MAYATLHRVSAPQPSCFGRIIDNEVAVRQGSISSNKFIPQFSNVQNSATSNPNFHQIGQLRLPDSLAGLGDKVSLRFAVTKTPIAITVPTIPVGSGTLVEAAGVVATM